MRTSRLLTMCCVIGALAFLAIPIVAWAAEGEPLFTPSAQEGDIDHSSDPTIVRSRFVNVNMGLLSAGDEPPAEEADTNAVLTLNLFDDVTVTAIKKFVKPNLSGSDSWVGHLEDVDMSEVILVSKDEILVGNIRMPGAFYQVRYVGSGVHAIYQIDQSKFPEQDCHPATETGVIQDDNTIFPEQGESANDLGPEADSAGSLDVMVVYTDDARSAAGGTTAMNNLIDLAITESNQGYVNSGVSQSLNLVHTAEISYAESGNILTDRNRLRNPSDGFMDSVHTWRNTYGADLVPLIVANGGGYCGIAYIMTTVSTTFEDYAFCVVADNCATGYYSFAHELGHIMSARHDWYVDDTVNSPYSYNHGYVNRTDSWRTIMAYNTECDDAGGYCTRLNYWSNPAISYGGDPMGVAAGTSTSCVEGVLSPNCDADNETTLDNTDYTVANFRQRIDDAYEENDTRTTAYSLATRERDWLTTIAGYGIQYDDDWYRIEVTPNYERLYIDCQFTDSEGNINIALYNSGGAFLTSSTSTSDNELIDYTVSSSGTYYIRVYYGNAGNTYDLWWDDLPHNDMSTGSDAYTGLSASASATELGRNVSGTGFIDMITDEYDQYKVPVSDGEVVRITFTPPSGATGIDLYVYQPDMSGGQVASNITSTHIETVTVSGNGYVYFAIDADSGDDFGTYNLSVSVHKNVLLWTK